MSTTLGTNPIGDSDPGLEKLSDLGMKTRLLELSLARHIKVRGIVIRKRVLHKLGRKASFY
jgi:hypothetical protein